jgi:uncharacterized protein with PIN domain
MPLSKKELEDLVRIVGLTRETELHCQQCLNRVAEFAETQLEGKSIPESLKAVEQHLSICGECRDEYEALERALKEMDG